MATDFETFVKLELPRRPVLISDVPNESVIVRRGPGAKVLDGVVLNDGDLLGQVDGRIVGVRGMGTGYNTVTVPPMEERTIDSYTDIGYARKWVIDITDLNKSMAFEILVKTHSGTVSYQIHSKIGDKIPIRVNTSASGNNIDLKIQSDHNTPIRVTSTVLR